MAGYINPKPMLDDEDKNINVGVANIEEVESDYRYKKTVYFAFIDVLGFKKNFDDHKEDLFNVRESNTNTEFAEKYKEVFNYYFELMHAGNLVSSSEKRECYAGQTSDSLYFYTYRTDLLVEYIKLFLHFNLFAMSKNVFFRGGIAKGNLFIKEPYQFYGESVIYSYLLESDISKFPIVMIDDNTYKAIEEYDENKLLVKDDKNDRHYLNIFAPWQKSFSMNVIGGMFKIRDVEKEDILENIKKNIKIFEYDEKNYGKYRFLLKEYQAEVEKHKI